MIFDQIQMTVIRTWTIHSENHWTCVSAYLGVRARVNECDQINSEFVQLCSSVKHLYEQQKQQNSKTESKPAEKFVRMKFWIVNCAIT